MTTAAAHDQFDGVFGARRGGGASHQVLPPIDASYLHDLLAALRDGVQADEGTLLQVRERAPGWLLGQFSLTAAAGISRTFADRLGGNRSAQTLTRAAHDYVTDLADGHLRPDGNLIAAGIGYVIDAAAVAYAARLTGSTGAGTVRELVTGEHYLLLHDIIDAGPHLETHGRGPQLMEASDWRTAFAQALRAVDVPAAEHSLAKSILATR